MDIEQAREFARGQHHAVLATRTSGGIQQSPVLVTVDEAGQFVVSSRETAYKTTNLRRDPWAQLCLLPDRFFGEWYVVQGAARIVSLPDAMDALIEYYRSISGEHQDWDAYRAAMEQERRVAIVIDAHRAGPTRHG